MPKKSLVISAMRNRIVACSASGVLLLLTSCAATPPASESPHLASIQSAVTCPTPPAHHAVTHPSRAFTTPPSRVIQRNVGYCAYIATSRGIISVRLRPEYAPNAVNDFVSLAQHGFYDGLTFYQVCPAATASACPAHATAALAGDPTATGTGGPGYSVKADPVIGEYLFGAVAMLGNTPATIGSRFFMSQGDSSGVSRQYDIFGQVTDGIPALALLAKGDAILWIAVVPTAPEP